MADREEIRILNEALEENARLRRAGVLLEQLELVLRPLDSKIEFSLHVGTVEQMRADLSYLRGLLGEAHAEIKKALSATTEESE